MKKILGFKSIKVIFNILQNEFKIVKNDLSILKNDVIDIFNKCNNIPSISNSSTITESDKFALDAIEKNASIEGTLANILDNQTTHINRLKATVTKVNIYISGDGNDANDGSANAPFATLNAAIKFLTLFGNPNNGVTIWFQNSVIIPAGYYYFPSRAEYKFKGEAQFSGNVNFLISGCNISLDYLSIHILKASFLKMYVGGSYVRILNNVKLYADYTENYNISFINFFGATISGSFIFDNSSVLSLALRLADCIYPNPSDDSKKWITSTHRCVLGGTKSQYIRNGGANDNLYVSLS